MSLMLYAARGEWRCDACTLPLVPQRCASDVGGCPPDFGRSGGGQ